VLIFDLDGTVLAVNSFQNWVRALLWGRFGGLSFAARLRLSLATLRVMLERKLLRRGHDDTKARLQALWSAALAQDMQQIGLQDLLSELVGTVRPVLQPVLADVTAQRCDAVLATAAAAEYALALGMRLGFQHILATPFLGQGDGARQNVGAVKRDRTLAFLAEQGWGERPRLFFTDHPEDLPLLSVCDMTVWLGDASGLAAVRAAAPATCQIILPEALAVTLAGLSAP
jgi:phosphoserine phosphatase